MHRTGGSRLVRAGPYLSDLHDLDVATPVPPRARAADALTGSAGLALLVTAVQRAPEAAPTAAPTPTASADPNAADPKDTTLPTGSLMLTP